MSNEIERQIRSPIVHHAAKPPAAYAHLIMAISLELGSMAWLGIIRTV